ncbi:MAG: sigma factor-like helix-turn-helix DNA-binding protein [Micropruina sp.]
MTGAAGDRFRSSGPNSSAAGRAQDRIDDRDEVARMLATLTPKQRRIVVLRYFDDYTEAQTAECLGISVGAVKSACSRALWPACARHSQRRSKEPGHDDDRGSSARRLSGSWPMQAVPPSTSGG